MCCSIKSLRPVLLDLPLDFSSSKDITYLFKPNFLSDVGLGPTTNFFITFWIEAPGQVLILRDITLRSSVPFKCDEALSPTEDFSADGFIY